MIEIFDSNIRGIPCQIQVDDYTITPPLSGSAQSFEDIEYTILDRNGKELEWLERKITPADDEQIVNEIRGYNNE